ncbi:hypothetical protein D9619_012913 [Psilocybe cf. subviscida]|uniref:Uncharacterized protein n=1 Tax=Psilocybe cf. subviscida TaxID=2480587 RepID=A0A8H5BII8_9AGAR|nr:hypothetical protein D9619_012913 [Psilocybe cf. subviscida]
MDTVKPTEEARISKVWELCKPVVSIALERALPLVLLKFGSYLANAPAVGVDLSLARRRSTFLADCSLPPSSFNAKTPNRVSILERYPPQDRSSPLRDLRQHGPRRSSNQVPAPTLFRSPDLAARDP